ncbi:DUF2512 family protein [Paenibacillus mendelii]|uniref:DUF2512 family protein n=1 Tax=Paenibacillus mendelii TaxID=206163 RepID=A0ABV6J9A8_9BACL|nr:DUF2512 family protein [Paenibacillus mendelii]MCQ6559774.1 YndM family protein [Paenibacillus mendelii]
MKFVLKWVVNSVIVVSLFMYYSDASFVSSVITATLLTIIAYLVGDQLILRFTNNLAATFSDAVLAFVFLWTASYVMNWGLDFSEIFFISLLLGAAEWILHRYVFDDRITAQEPK